MASPVPYIDGRAVRRIARSVVACKIALIHVIILEYGLGSSCMQQLSWLTASDCGANNMGKSQAMRKQQDTLPLGKPDDLMHGNLQLAIFCTPRLNRTLLGIVRNTKLSLWENIGSPCLHDAKNS